MAKFKSHLDEARRASEADYQRCLVKAGRGGSGSPSSILAGNATVGAREEARSRERIFDATEQYRHFRGQSYVSIRPIAQRIAGQPIRLALIGNKQRTRGQKLVETRQFDMPMWVKHLAAKSEDFTVVDQHPVLDTLHNPSPGNPFFNDWSLKYCTVGSLELTGFYYWWIYRKGGTTQILPLPANWVRAVRSETDLFSSWELWPEAAGPPIPLEKHEIAPFVYPDPANPFCGLGPTEANAREIIVNEFVTEAQKRAFQLGIHPGALITLGQAKLSDGKTAGPPRLKNWQLEQAIQVIKSRYMGMTHFGEPMFLDRLISDVKPYGYAAKEMDFGMNADKSRERVEQGYGTNPYIVGAAGLGSRAESATADEHFCQTTVNPKIELLSRVLSIVVLPLLDTSGKFVLFIEPARAHDSEMEQKEWETGLKNATVTINQYNSQVLRQPPVPWGDAVVVPNGYSIVPVSQLQNGFVPAKPGATQPADASTPTSGSSTPTGEDPESESAAEAEGDEPPKSHHVARKAFDDAFYDNFVETWLKAHGEQETSMANAVEAFFAQQGDDVASKLEALGDDDSTTADGIASKVFDANAWDNKFREAVKPAFAKALGRSAKQELDAFGNGSQTAKAASLNFDFGVDVPETVMRGIEKALTEAFAQDYWSDIQETTKDQLAASIKDGLDSGKQMRDIAKSVRQDVFGGDIAKERAKAISRSEITNALGSGAHEARLELYDEGVITGKEWFATYDGKTRNAHLNADGQQRDVNEPFEVGGESARWPGDPNLSAKNRINCRCASTSVTAFSKRTRAPHVKAFLSRGCEVHGLHHSN